jgi:hypothetical protein
MLKMPDTKAKYFSVKHGTKIQGALYVPSVCYPLPQGLQTVIEEMAAKDMARIYPEKVRFVTGVPYPVKKPGSALRPSSVPVPEARAEGAVKPAARKPSVPERTGRKSGRGAYTAQANREFD